MVKNVGAGSEQMLTVAGGEAQEFLSDGGSGIAWICDFSIGACLVDLHVCLLLVCGDSNVKMVVEWLDVWGAQFVSSLKFRLIILAALSI